MNGRVVTDDEVAVERDADSVVERSVEETVDIVDVVDSVVSVETRDEVDDCVDESEDLVESVILEDVKDDCVVGRLFEAVLDAEDDDVMVVGEV